MNRRRPQPPPPPVQPQPSQKPRFPYFLLFSTIFTVWFVWSSLAADLPVAGGSIKLYSNQCRQDIRTVLLSAIQRAKNSVHLVMFGLTDRSVLGALRQKIDEQIPTKVYYDVGGSGKIFRLLQGAEVHPIKNGSLMHQKVLVIDRSLIFIGSANMTSSSLNMHDNLVIGLHSPQMAKFLESHEPFSPGYFRTKVAKQEVELWLLPDPRGHAIQSLRKKVRNAKRTVRCALFTLTHPSLVDALIDAHARGVHVSLVIDKHSALGASQKAVASLQKAGVPVYFSKGSQLLHHKFVYIDGETLVTGSANWTKSAFYKNSDCILTLHSLTPDQKQFMNTLWRQIELGSQVDERTGF